MTALDERASGGGRGRAYRWPFRLITALLELGDGDHSLAEIAHALRVPTAHASQVLSAGIDENWVDRPRYGRYALRGPVPSRRLQLAASGQPRDADHSPLGQAEVLAQLASLQRRSGGLVILHGLIEIVTPWHVHLACNDGGLKHLRALIDDEHLPSYLPLTQGAGGHAMIPWLDPRLALRVLSAPRHPGGVLVEPLAEPSEAIRDRGYAITHADEWTTIAAPLLGWVAGPGAVSVTVPADSVAPDPGSLLRAADVLQDLLAFRATGRA